MTEVTLWTSERNPDHVSWSCLMIWWEMWFLFSEFTLPHTHWHLKDTYMNQKAILFFPCVHNSILLSITSEYRLFSVFLNAGDQLQGKTLEWWRRAFSCSLWMAFGLLDIMCKANKSMAFARATHTLGLLCHNPALRCMRSFGLQVSASTCILQAKKHFWMVT